MNPELPSPQIRPESQPVGPEQRLELPDHEAVGERSHEREQNIGPGDQQPAAPPPLPVPLPQLHVPVPVPVAPVQDDAAAGPVLASDDDLIEKEWVDKAKKIIATTQNDPYRREKEVTKLQIDYLRKRYGKELGTSN
ncbi:MAG: hypothetical protein JWO07_63 [Candidatus Saccharibacteria bacterium]|nr:hypothetical protein [Candidatus Saccharibacteria bacterium]